MKLMKNMLLLSGVTYLTTYFVVNADAFSIFLKVGMYILYSYINYRIIAKFDATVTFLECLIPIWNGYLFMRIITQYPIFYTVVLALWPFLLIHFRDNMSHAVFNINCFGICLICAILFGILGEKLGKNFYLCTLLGAVPLVNLIVLLVFAFDNSRPIQEEELS